MPDLPERIVKQFEEDSIHVREFQKRKQEADIAFDKRSQYMAFVIIMFGFVGTLILAYRSRRKTPPFRAGDVRRTFG